MKQQFIEENSWVYLWHKSTEKFTFGKIKRTSQNQPFSKNNSSIYIPGYGQTNFDCLEDIIFVFPNVEFKPIHILISKLERE